MVVVVLAVSVRVVVRGRGTKITLTSRTILLMTVTWLITVVVAGGILLAGMLTVPSLVVQTTPVVIARASLLRARRARRVDFRAIILNEKD